MCASVCSSIVIWPMSPPPRRDQWLWAPFCNPFGCSSGSLQPGFHQNAAPIWLDVLGGTMEWRWVSTRRNIPVMDWRSGKSRELLVAEDGAQPSAWGSELRGPPEELLGPFFYHLVVLEKRWFPPGGASRWHVLPGGTRWRRRSKDSVPCRSGCEWIASHCCDESAGLSPQHAELCPPARPASASGHGSGDGALWSPVSSRTRS